MMTYRKEIIMQLKKLLIFQVSHHAIVSNRKISGQKRSSRAVSLFYKTSAA